MKTFFTLFFIILCISMQAQVSGTMRVGYAFKTVQPFISPSLNVTAHNISFGAEMIVYPKQDAPCDFGARISYQYKFIEAGAGRYYQLFSTDDYDQYKNGWANAFFIAAHYKSFFLQYDYLRGNQFSVGFKQNF